MMQFHVEVRDKANHKVVVTCVGPPDFDPKVVLPYIPFALAHRSEPALWDRRDNLKADVLLHRARQDRVPEASAHIKQREDLALTFVLVLDGESLVGSRLTGLVSPTSSGKTRECEHPPESTREPRLEVVASTDRPCAMGFTPGTDAPATHDDLRRHFLRLVVELSSPKPAATLPREAWFIYRDRDATVLGGWLHEWTVRTNLHTVKDVVWHFFSLPAGALDATLADRCTVFFDWLRSKLGVGDEVAALAVKCVCCCVLELPPAARHAAMTGTEDLTPYKQHLEWVRTQRAHAWKAGTLFSFEAALGVQLPVEVRVLLLNGGLQALTVTSESFTARDVAALRL